MSVASKVDTRWFQGKVADRRLSQRKVAAMMGMDPGALSLAFHGKRKLSADEVAELAALLKVDVAEVIQRAGAGAPSLRKPVAERNNVKAEAEDHEGDFEAEFMQRWVSLGMMLLRNRGPV